MTLLKGACTPNGPQGARWPITVGWVALWLACWTLFRPAVMPSPLATTLAFPNLWLNEGLGPALAASFKINLEALIISTAVALPLSYLSRVPLVQPLAIGVSKLRCLSPAVFYLPLLFMGMSGHGIKLSMVVLGETLFLVTTMTGVVLSIPTERFDEALTLRMSDWTAVWYVVVRGTLAQAFQAVRDNAAMGWPMLLMVEGLVRSEGGVGLLSISQEKYFSLDGVIAISFVVVATGIGIDWALGEARKAACPYADLRTA